MEKKDIKIVKMAQSIDIEKFNEDVEDFETYISRIKLFFIVNDTDVKKQVPLLLTLIGAKGYTLAKNLLSPKTPESCKLEEIINALTNYYKPKMNVVYERYKFYSRNQKHEESISDFVKEIKTLAHTCEFGDTLTVMLRDRFVMGIAHNQTQQNLLSEPDLTFQKAVDVALTREAAIRDMKKIKNQNSSQSDSTVYKIQQKSSYSHNKSKSNSNSNGNYKKQFSDNPKSGQNSRNQNENKPRDKCSGCGAWHWKKDCPFLSAECFSCKKVGHISKMCQNKSKTNFIRENPSNELEYDFIFNIKGSKVPPIAINVLLNGRTVSMELDTGSYYSIMPASKLNEVWPISTERPQLQSFSRQLNVYGGSPLKVEGLIKVDAKMHNGTQLSKAEIIIVADDGPILLGRGLMKDLGVSNIDLSKVNNVVSSNSNWKKEFPDLFAPELGCYKGKTFELKTDESVKPKFFKARPVPYALRDRVNTELDRLTKEGIISPVTYSDWGAPMVPVLKTDGAVRVCGDYKLTVNLASHVDNYPIPRVQDLFSNLSNSTLFTKLDMSQAYAQLELDEASKNKEVHCD